jgi:general stress protein YciG
LLTFKNTFMPERDQREQAMNGQEQNVSGRGNGMENGNSNNDGQARRGTANRGFAAMSPERQKAIASEGGRAAHKQGVAHEWSSDEAREAGRKGGQSVSRNREHMSEIGRKGGQVSGTKRSTPKNEGER